MAEVASDRHCHAPPHRAWPRPSPARGAPSTGPPTDDSRRTHRAGRDLPRGDAVGEPCVRDRRLAAHKRFADQGWPDSSKDEFWRSTPFKRIPTDLPLVDGSEAEAPPPRWPTTPRLRWPPRLWSMAPGEHHRADRPRRAGRRAASLDDPEHAELVGERLTTLTSGAADHDHDEVDRTVALNDAAWTAGVLLHVPADVELAAARPHPRPRHHRRHPPAACAGRPRPPRPRHGRASSTPPTDPGDERVLVDEVVEAFCADASALQARQLSRTGPAASTTSPCTRAGWSATPASTRSS